MIRDALKKSNSRFAYIAPTYKMAKNISWDYLKHYSKDIPGIKTNESELRIDYPNGARITLYGADNPDSLRGIKLRGVVFDEYSQQPSNIFGEIIRPTLADTRGYAIWIGTPKGKNEFYRLYKKAKGRKWLRLLLETKDTNLIPQEELDDAREMMTPDEYEQEWNCSFEASIQGAYYADQIRKAREENRIGKVPYEMSLPVNTYWDLGVGDSTTIGFFQKLGAEERMIDYYEASGEGIKHYIDILEKKKYTYGIHTAPHDIEVRELGTGKSRKVVASALGLDFQVAPNLPIDDGINSVRMRFNKLWIDEEKCQKFIDAITQYHKEWDDKRGEFKNQPFHDWTSHAADMLRYWAVTEGETNQDIPTSY